MDFKVKCVRVICCPEYFTEGKIYDVVNGSIIADDGTDFDTWSNPMCCREYSNTFESLCEWFKMWYEFELVEEENTMSVFTKNDLKTGMFGVMDNGWYFVVVDNLIVYENGEFDKVSRLDDDLCMNYKSISKLYTGCKCFNMIKMGSSFMELVYDRERDTKKPYNGKVVCIDNTHNPGLYTVGKIYQFVDGVMVGDNGTKFGDVEGEDFYSFEDWDRFTCSKFIEIVE